jgi:hypothetical protein
MAERESVYVWSTTAAGNGSIDPSINFAEGQLPGTVNNSNRSVLAASARFIRDINGTILTSGSANAYVATTSETWSAHSSGHMLGFKANFTNTAAATLAVTNADGSALGSKAIRGPGDVALTAGQLVASGIYDVRYDASANAAVGAWVLLNPTVPAAGLVKTPTIPGGRLTLTSAVPVTTADVSGATNVHYTPAGNDYVDVYDGSNWVPYQFTEMTLPLDSDSTHTGYHASAKAFHVAVFTSGGALRLGTGVAWNTATSTGSGAGTAQTEVYEGRLVNAVSVAMRFGTGSASTATISARQARIVGGIYTSNTGTVDDTAIKRYVSNLHNSAERYLCAPASSTLWTLTTSTEYSQAANSTANQWDYFHVIDGRAVTAFVLANSNGVNSTKGFYVPGIGVDTTTVNGANGGFSPGNSDSTLYAPSFALYRGHPGIGLHSIKWIEKALVSNRAVAGTSQYAISGNTMN